MDTLYRVVKSRGEKGEEAFYRTIADYGARIVQAAGKSADIDLHRLGRVPGGNAPLLANGLACQDVAVTLMGALGYPEPDPVFASLHKGMRIHSFADPCQTIALEFGDGKVMMGDLQASQDINWQRLLALLGEDTVTAAVEAADLIGMVNWSAHRGIRDIARGIAGLLRHDGTTSPARRKPCFFDLSDPTSLPRERLLEYLRDIADFGTFSDTVLSLNENEACAVFGALYPQLSVQDTLDGADVDALGKAAREDLGLRLLCVHTNAYALGFAKDQTMCAAGFHVETPKVSTGGGDNFNAGLCRRLMAALSLPQCFLLAIAMSSYYVTHARSADRAGLAAHIRQRLGNTSSLSKDNMEESV